MTTDNVDATVEAPMPEPISGEELLEMANLEGCELTVPMTEWVAERENDPKVCTPCDLATIAPWYREMLSKGGFDTLADEVNALAEGEPTGMEIAEVLDSVKVAVDNEAVRSNLKLYDCFAQSFQQEEASED